MNGPRNEFGLLHHCGYTSLSYSVIQNDPQQLLVLYSRRNKTTELAQVIDSQVSNGVLIRITLKYNAEHQEVLNLSDFHNYYVLIVEPRRYKSLAIEDIKREYHPLFVLHNPKVPTTELVRVLDYHHSNGTITKVTIQYTSGRMIELDASTLSELVFHNA